jgi:hypothetical protein
MYSNIKEIKMLEIIKCTEVKKQQNHDYLAFRHPQKAIPVSLAIAGLNLKIFEFFGEFLAEIVRNAENFDNFVWNKKAHIFRFVRNRPMFHYFSANNVPQEKNRNQIAYAF